MSAAARVDYDVLIVGAGPSGLSAAYHLARRGHRVTVREAGPLPGGMMRFGIPKYRLPRDVLDAEVQRIVDMGVRIEYGRKVSDIAATMREGGYDAAFLAVGAHIAKRAYIPAGDSARVLDAVAVLRSMEGEDRPLLGRRSSSTAPWCCSTSQVARLSGRRLRLRAAGNSATRPSRNATQSFATGQRAQAGFARVQSVAPKSMIACV